MVLHLSSDQPPCFSPLAPAWGEQVLQSGKIKARLIGELDPDEWDLPPKPKWMRWSTYNRLEARFDHYEDVLDTGLLEIAARLLGRR